MSRTTAPSAVPRPPAAAAPLVGAAAEGVARRLRHALSHAPAVVLLAGEAGAGKTRILRELRPLSESGGTPVRTGHCPPPAPARHGAPAGPGAGPTEAAPYGPFVAALRSAAPRGPLSLVTAALRPLLPELADRLPAEPPDPPTSDPAVAHHRLLRAWHDLLAALGDVVVVIEDVQWADPGTHALLEHLVTAPPPGLRLCLTYRPEDLPVGRSPARLLARLPPGTARDELTLPPLDHDGLRALVTAWHGAVPPTDGAVRRLRARTLGNPAAATELLRQEAATGGVAEEQPVPPVLRAALLEQAERLTRSARLLAEAAAVLEHPVTEELLLRVAGLDGGEAPDDGTQTVYPDAVGRASAEAGLADAVAAGVLRHDAVDHQWRLTRPLLGEALRAALPLDRARALHRRAAAALRRRTPTPYPRLVHHYRHAGLPEAWADCAERAADQHLAAGEDAAAADLLRTALASQDLPATRRAGLAVRLGRASGYGLAPRETLDVLHRTLEGAQLTRVERGELRLAYGLMLNNQAGRHGPSRLVLARAAAELSGPHPALASRAMSALAVPRATPHPAEVHRRWARAATAAAERSGDPVTRTAVAVNRATLLVQLGDPQAWSVELPVPAPAGSPTERGRQRELARGTLNLADGAVHLGHYGRAARWLRRAAEQTATADTPYYRLGVGTTGLLLDWATGRWDQLAARADRYAHSTEVAGLPMMTVEVRLVRALLALASSDPGEAERLLRDIHQPSAPGATAPVSAAMVGALARILLARGEATAAWATAEPMVRIVEAKGIWVWAAELPPAFAALLATGDTAQAGELVDRFAAGLAGTDAPAAEAALLRCRSLLAQQRGQLPRAAGLAADAEAAYRSLPRPYEAAQVRESRARCAPRDGTSLLEEALEQFTALGATWDASRCRQALRERGAAPRPVGRRGYGDRLSPREEETVRLAAAGRTNREIAATLYMSARTAESHVANALRKLGLRSRRELPAYLAANATADAPTSG